MELPRPFPASAGHIISQFPELVFQKSRKFLTHQGEAWTCISSSHSSSGANQTSISSPFSGDFGVKLWPFCSIPMTSGFVLFFGHAQEKRGNW